LLEKLIAEYRTIERHNKEKSNFQIIWRCEPAICDKIPCLGCCCWDRGT